MTGVGYDTIRYNMIRNVEDNKIHAQMLGMFTYKMPSNVPSGVLFNQSNIRVPPWTSPVIYNFGRVGNLGTGSDRKT